MALTNRQIERYSRQIIVDKFGGISQERLLASRVLLIANDTDAETVLAYLVGAGIGRIDLRSEFDRASRESMVARMRDLNTDSVVNVGTEAAAEAAQFDLALAIVSDRATLDRTRELCERPFGFAMIIARIDAPAKLAVIPARPPCPKCAAGCELLAPIGPRVEIGGFFATLAAVEAVKLLAQFNPAQKPALVEFNGYTSAARVLDSNAEAACACGGTSAEKSRG
ncbi:MAG: ThiF family adenylyltransferase [Deltaproteobacteria bacterium]|nr:ThiF family adenylyltransferase [Deltaproteobacteria bacterium]